MSTKQTILGMTALFVLCMGYYFFLVYYVYPKHPQWMVAQTQPDQTESAPLSSQQSGNSISSSTFPSSQSSISPATMPSGLQAIVTGPSVASAKIGSTQPSDPTYALGMDVSPLAASLDSVTINSFKNIDADGLYVFQQPIDPSMPARLPPVISPSMAKPLISRITSGGSNPPRATRPPSGSKSSAPITNPCFT